LKYGLGVGWAWGSKSKPRQYGRLFLRPDKAATVVIRMMEMQRYLSLIR
jgi:hypothetical protein